MEQGEQLLIIQQFSVPLAGVRGGIWFVMWAILFIVFVFIYPIVELEVTVRPQPGRVKPKVYTLAIGNCSARSTNNVAAQRDLTLLQHCE